MGSVSRRAHRVATHPTAPAFCSVCPRHFISSFSAGGVRIPAHSTDRPSEHKPKEDSIAAKLLEKQEQALSQSTSTEQLALGSRRVPQISTVPAPAVGPSACFDPPTALCTIASTHDSRLPWIVAHTTHSLFASAVPSPVVQLLRTPRL